MQHGKHRGRTVRTGTLSSINLIYASADNEQRLKAALWFSIGKIVDEETLKLGINATPQFIGSLTEMVWSQIGTSKLHKVVRIVED